MDLELAREPLNLAEFVTDGAKEEQHVLCVICWSLHKVSFGQQEGGGGACDRELFMIQCWNFKASVSNSYSYDVTPLPVGPGLSEAFLHCISANRRPGWNADCLQHVQLGFYSWTKYMEMRWNEWQEANKWQKKSDPFKHCFTFPVPSCNFIWQFGSSFGSRNIIDWD